MIYRGKMKNLNGHQNDSFTESPVLLMPESSKPFVLETDASLFASRAVLRQQNSDGDWHPCTYLSKSFNDTECNYDIWDRELLAVIWALTEWRHYLQGSPHTVTLLSDHHNLAYFRKPQRLNWRQAGWSLLLTKYDLKLVHIPGTRMIQSNALSQQLDLCPKNNQDNVDKTLLLHGLLLAPSHWVKKNWLTTLTKPYYQTTYSWIFSTWIFKLRLSPGPHGFRYSDSPTNKWNPSHEVCPVRLAAQGWHCILQG